MNPFLVEIDHRPLAGIVGQRRKEFARGCSLKRRKKEELTPIDAQREVHECIAHRADAVEEDDGLFGGATACTSAGCTAWNDRIGLFGSAASGEIIAGTGDPNYAFYLWLDELSSGAICGFGAQNGHRYLILSGSGAVGVGVTTQSVGDFGSGGAPYKIPSAAHYPQQAAAVDLWANWYDTAGPRSANAIVDGHCVALSLKRGSPLNGAWSATVSGVGSGCHRYYFSFIDSSGAEVTYPATGSLGIGCADWDSSRMVGSCGATSSTPSRHRASRH